MNMQVIPPKVHDNYHLLKWKKLVAIALCYHLHLGTISRHACPKWLSPILSYTIST